MMNLNPIFIRIAKENSVEEVQERMQELKGEFVNDGWEDEFDDIDEAYEEQGRCEAENQVITELITENSLTLPAEDDHKLRYMLAGHYEFHLD